MKFIISGYDNLNNLDRNDTLLTDLILAGISPKVITKVKGCYKDIKEEAYLIECSKQLEPLIESLQDKFNQESYLKVNDDNKGWLVYNDCTEFLGDWRQVTEIEAKKQDAYTKIGQAYYICN